MTCATNALITAFATALTTGDAPRLALLLEEQVAYRIPGRSAVAGVHHGREHVTAMLTEPASPGITIDAADVTESMADGQRGLVIVLLSGTSPTGPVNVEVALHLQTNGELIAGITEYSGDQHLIDELLGGPVDSVASAPAANRRNRWLRRS